VKWNRNTLLALAMSASVLALTGCGKTSSVTTPASALAPTAPAAPTNVHATYDSTANRDYLNWTLSASASVVSYEVWSYSTNPATGTPVGMRVGTPAASVSSLALPVESAVVTKWFRVRAVDTAGNSSAFSSTAAVDLHAWGGSTTNPGAPVGKGQDPVE